MSDLVKVKSVVVINPSLIADIKASAARALEHTGEALHAEVVQAEVVPRMDGTLQGESFFVDFSESWEGRVSLVHSEPYARRLYYHPEYHFRREAWTDSKGRNHHGNPNAKGKWFEDWTDGQFVAETFQRYLEMEANL